MKSFPHVPLHNLDEESDASLEEGDRRPGHFEMVQDYNNNVYHLPAHAKPLDYLLFVPKAILYFFLRLIKTFGLKVIFYAYYTPKKIVRNGQKIIEIK